MPGRYTDCKQGPREILLNGELGPLAEVGSPESLADAMERVLEQPVPRERLLERARDFTFANAAQGYQELIGGWSACGGRASR